MPKPIPPLGVVSPKEYTTARHQPAESPESLALGKWSPGHLNGPTETVEFTPRAKRLTDPETLGPRYASLTEIPP